MRKQVRETLAARQAALMEKVSKGTAAIKKGKKGGKRAGAGRKPNFLKRSGLDPMTAHIILANFDLVKLWSSVLNCNSPDVRLRALQYLTDREQGKAPDRLISTGTIGNGITVRFVRPDETEMSRIDAELERRFGPEKLALRPPVIDAEPVPAAAEPAVMGRPVLVPKPDLTGTMSPELTCAKHGKYFRAPLAKSDICPDCVFEGVRDQMYLQSLLPNRTV